jgi:hypothetical protein
MNVCLQSEEVLSSDSIQEAGEAIIDRYLKLFGEHEDDLVNFCRECFAHSTPKTEVKATTDDGDDDKEEDVIDEKDEKLLEDFLNNEDPSTLVSQISPEELRSLGAFVEDMAKSYREYGAQFDLCTKCIRIFLLPCFPPSIRCRVLQELHGMLHLLTLPKEMENDDEIVSLLRKSISGGADEETVIRDSPDILNKAIEILSKDKSSSTRTELGDYVTMYCIALLSRNLGISLKLESGVQAMKQRLEKLDSYTAKKICQATSLFLHCGGTKDDLVRAVLKAISSSDDSNECDRVVVDSTFIEECLSQGKS